VPDATVERGAIPEVYNWDLTALFASDAAWEKERAAVESEIGKLQACQGKLAGPASLRKCLDLYFGLHDRANHVTLYAGLRLTTAQSDDALQTMNTRALAVMDRLMSEASFLRTEILALPPETLEAAYAAEPELAEHRAYIENLVRRQDRVFSPETERVLSLAGDNLWAEIDLNEIPSHAELAFRALLTDIPWPVVHDEEGKEVQLTLANYGRFRASKDRAVRREAVTAFLGTLREYQRALAATLTGQFAFDVFCARARGYDTALEAYLDKDDLEVAVFDNLIDTVNAHLESLHRYVELRKRVLGLEDLHLYDLYVPMVAAVDMEVTFPEARTMIYEALEPLGADYRTVLAEGLDPRNGWMDLYPSRDKDSGASSSAVYGRHPFIKMNYQDSVDDMSTLAHEFGHALHSWLAMKEQPYSSFRYVPFLAEVASTCNEALLSDYIIARAPGKAEKAALLVERAENIRQTIYRQTMFAEFERAVHGFVEQGVPVTATLLDETYAGLVRKYYGPGFTVDENDGMEWAYIPHFYWKYYVFSYATGMSSGIAIAKRIQSGEEGAVEDYLGMLKGGSSRPPLELLRLAGADLTKPDAIAAALKLFAETIDELEELL
jgi:oligoendopeptidase F